MPPSKPPWSYFPGAEEGLGTRLAHSGAVPGEWRRNDLYIRVHIIMCLKEPENPSF